MAIDLSTPPLASICGGGGHAEPLLEELAPFLDGAQGPSGHGGLRGGVRASGLVGLVLGLEV